MPASRLDLLRQQAALRPDDPFPLYGVAMELRKAGPTSECIAAFEELVARHPGYVATYLMFGQTLRDAGQPMRARDVFHQGIKAAKAAGDAHAAGELQAALDGLDTSGDVDGG
jgi:predicted Zn-dependent protease